MKARRGDTVMIAGVHSNGTHEQVAIITRIWGDADPVHNPGVCVNLHVLPDDYVSHTRAHVPLYASAEQAATHSARLPFCFQREE